MAETPEKPQTVADLRATAEKLEREGRMPTLEQFLDAVGKTRRKYSGRILKARRETPPAKRTYDE